MRASSKLASVKGFGVGIGGGAEGGRLSRGECRGAEELYRLTGTEEDELRADGTEY